MKSMKKVVFLLFSSPLLFSSMTMKPAQETQEIISPTSSSVQAQNLDLVTSPNVDQTTVYENNQGPTITIKGNDYCKQVLFAAFDGHTIQGAYYQLDLGEKVAFFNQRFFQTPGDYIIQVYQDDQRFTQASFTIYTINVVNRESDRITGDLSIAGDRSLSATAQEDKFNSTHTIAASYQSGQLYMDIQQKIVIPKMPKLRGTSTLVYLIWQAPYTSYFHDLFNNDESYEAMVRYNYHTYDELLGTIENKSEVAEVALFTPNITGSILSQFASSLAMMPYIPYDEVDSFAGNTRYKIYDSIEFFLSVRVKTRFSNRVTIDTLSHINIIGSYVDLNKKMNLTPQKLTSLFYNLNDQRIVLYTTIRNFENYVNKTRPVSLYFNQPFV